MKAISSALVLAAWLCALGPARAPLAPAHRDGTTGTAARPVAVDAWGAGPRWFQGCAFSTGLMAGSVVMLPVNPIPAIIALYVAEAMFLWTCS